MSGMHAHQVLASIGLSAEIVGAVLVGIEAVKLENVHRFKDWFEIRFPTFLNPTIVCVEGRLESRNTGLRTATFDVLLPFTAGLGPLAASYLLLKATGVELMSVAVRMIDTAPLWARPMIAVVGGWEALALTAAVGVVVLDTVVVGLVVVIEVALDAIEEHMRTGGLGMIGILFLLVGFGLQLAAVWT